MQTEVVQKYGRFHSLPTGCTITAAQQALAADEDRRSASGLALVLAAEARYVRHSESTFRTDVNALVICAYCGAAENLTRDHIPPKAIFPKPRPSDLITVPACRMCNASFQSDDEYFAASLAMRAGIERTPQGRRLVKAFGRSLKRPESHHFQEFLDTTLRVADKEDWVSYGVDPGTIGQWIDATRLGRTTDRIVRGLFYHETGTRIPPDYEVKSIMLEQADEMAKIAMISPLIGQVPVEAANGAFAYVWKAKADDAYRTTWLLVFYAEAASFLVATGRRPQ